MTTRELHYDDCLDILPNLADESVDLIYLDPPFKSDANYNMLFGGNKGDDAAQLRAFADTWYWRPDHEDIYLALIQRGGSIGKMIEALRTILGHCGMLAYLMFMTERLVAMKRVMKPTASIYLHCDPSASHYLKIVMDGVFGANMFLNEVVWRRTSSHSDAKTMGSVHDIIFHYSITDKFKWNKQYQPYEKAYEEKRFKHHDADGRRWMDGDLSAKGLSGGGYYYEYKGCASLWRVPEERMKDLDKENKLYFTSKGGIRIKRYLDELKGVLISDLWTDIMPINSRANERLGYPTQKPLALLERIIKASSDAGDVVLDPFCGCGTAVDAAEALGRQWIGIDVSCLSINLIKERMENVHGKAVSDQITVAGVPRDVAAAQMLFRKNPFEFERWAVGLIRGRPNDKQVGDKGSDGELIFPSGGSRPQRGIISVKGGKTINPAMVRDLAGSLDAHNANMGVLITLTPPTQGMINAANGFGQWTDSFTQAKWPKVQIITIDDLLESKTPNMPTQLSPYIKATLTHTASKQETLL